MMGPLLLGSPEAHISFQVNLQLLLWQPASIIQYTINICKRFCLLCDLNEPKESIGSAGITFTPSSWNP
jgi:hypothetical protein